MRKVHRSKHETLKLMRQLGSMRRSQTKCGRFEALGYLTFDAVEVTCVQCQELMATEVVTSLDGRKPEPYDSYSDNYDDFLS